MQRRKSIKTKTWSGRRRMPLYRGPAFMGVRRRRRSLATAVALGVEKKFLDAYASDIAVTAPTDCSGGEIQPEGGCIGCISAPAQGDGEQQRDGRKITVKNCFVNFTVRGSVQPDQADARPAPLVYVALVQDTQANGVTVVSEQVYTNPNDSAYVNTYPLRNLQYSSRYRVLAHMTVDLGPAYGFNDGAATGSIVCSEKTGKLSWNGEMLVTFNDTTANVAAVTDNALHVIAFSTTTNFSPVISFNSRVRFVG